ncbi:hypothetical protein D3H35_09935 [Cohnella faecalis]|uniref:Uncharacterized protein n=1 Tax=Cohnella faecalis TaxID=2315694 RepID=A0A398CNP1_9BACL|nr:hypothetical protein D3H35_09935 [Cohnella faecalis]
MGGSERHSDASPARLAQDVVDATPDGKDDLDMSGAAGTRKASGCNDIRPGTGRSAINVIHELTAPR